MAYNWEYITREETESSDSQTWIKDLPTKGGISALVIEFKATNGSTSNRGANIMQIISKIEVIGNGSEVITSLTGQEAVRLAWLKTGRFPPALLSEAPNDVQYQEFPILFGRYPGDTEYGLDLGKWNTVDIRITYDLATVRAVGATGFVSGSTVITVKALRAPPGEVPAYRGWLSTRELKTFTSAASGDEVVQLPIKRPYVGLGVYCYEAGVADNTDITKVKIDLDKGTRIFYDREWNHAQQDNASMYKVNGDVDLIGFFSNGDTQETWTGTNAVPQALAPLVGAI